MMLSCRRRAGEPGAIDTGQSPWTPARGLRGRKGGRVGHLYFGWWIVAAAVLVNMLAVGTTFTAFGLYVLPVSTEFKLSRANMNTALILVNFGMAGAAPLIGRLLDRAPAKLVMRVGAVALALSLITLGLSRSIWLSAAVMAVPLAAAVVAAGTMTSTVLTARWFTAQRGRALALAVIGMSLGSVVVSPVVALLIQSLGWRSALVISGAAAGAVLVTLSFLLRERPRPGEHERGASETPAQTAGADAPTGRPAKMGEILRMPQFWSIALGMGLAMGVCQTLVVTIVPLALEGGLTMVQATSLISISGVGAVASKLLLAVFADKVDRIALLAGLFIAGALMNLALLSSETYPMLIACAGLLGISSGVLPPVFYALVADRFGMVSFGTVRGLAAPVIAILGAIAVRAAGEVFDRTGGYNLLFSSFSGVMVVAAVLIFMTRYTKAAAFAKGAASA
jgi:sugar phosphate permease